MQHWRVCSHETRVAKSGCWVLAYPFRRSSGRQRLEAPAARSGSQGWNSRSSGAGARCCGLVCHSTSAGRSSTSMRAPGRAVRRGAFWLWDVGGWYGGCERVIVAPLHMAHETQAVRSDFGRSALVCTPKALPPSTPERPRCTTRPGTRMLVDGLCCEFRTETDSIGPAL